MPTITAKPLDEAMKAELFELTTGYHAFEISKKDASLLPENIYMIENDLNQLVGYGLIWHFDQGKKLIDKAEQDYFDKEDRYLEKDFYTDIKNKKDIVFIEALDILKEFERKGHAAFFLKWLKEKYPKNKIYVYAIYKSRNFWFKMGFKPIGSTNWVTFN